MVVPLDHCHITYSSILETHGVCNRHGDLYDLDIPIWGVQVGSIVPFYSLVAKGMERGFIGEIQSA